MEKKTYKEIVQEHPQVATYARITFISGLLLGVAVIVGIVAFGLIRH